MPEGPPSIWMLLTNPCVSDSRVLREARALADAGYDVRIVATQAPGTPEVESRDGFRIVRVPSEPRLLNLVRRVARRSRSVPPSAGSGTDLNTPGSGGEAQDAVVGRRSWMAAVGGKGDLRLLLGDPRGAAVRAAVRTMAALRWWRFARCAWRTVRRDPADLYLAHDLDTLPIASVASARLGGALIYDSHELYTDQSVSPPQSALARARWRLCERLLIRKADGVITVCDGIAEELADRYRIERPAVVRNIPELAGAPAEGEVGLRDRFEIGGGLRIALYLGGIQLNRRLEHLIDTVRPLSEVALVMMGPGDPAYVSHLREHAVRLGIQDRVWVAGPVPPERVAAVARDADIGLVVMRRASLSDWYCLPSKLFESIQAGVPVIANDWPELRRVVEGYGVGILCDSEEPEAIGAAIVRLLGDPERHEQMRANARKAREELNWENESARLIAAIRGAAAARAPAAPGPETARGARA
jgi:glycosyltransferase involved in cell wall biosynthesis